MPDPRTPSVRRLVTMAADRSHTYIIMEFDLYVSRRQSRPLERGVFTLLSTSATRLKDCCLRGVASEDSGAGLATPVSYLT